MESREKKTIKEKIDSIGNLPEGYNPNMDSKWALLEESLDKSNVSFFVKYRWLNIAAILVFIFGCTLLYFFKITSTQTASSGTNHQVKKNRTISTEKTLSSSAIIQNPEKKSDIHNNKSFRNLQNISQEPVNSTFIADQNILNKEETILLTENKPDETANITEPVIKKKKLHYVQIDFGNSVTPAEKQLANDSKGLHFKIGSNSENNFHLSSTEGNDPPLKFRKNF